MLGKVTAKIDNSVPVFFDKRMLAESHSFSPSSMKAGAVVEDWQRDLPIKLMEFEPVHPDELKKIHAGYYVDGILEGNIENGHGNTDKALAQSFLWTCGSMCAAAEHVLTTGRNACSPTSGFHHAMYAKSCGFCTFNGLFLAARRLLQTVSKVGILDLDYHWGNGTDDLIERTATRHVIDHWSMGAFTWKSGVSFLNELKKKCEEMEGDVILYQAGADAHMNDPLGGLLSTSQMSERDRIVFETFSYRRKPVVFNLAGGYQSLESVIKLHRTTMQYCCDCSVHT